MLLGGLWHGASWNFVIWGALHGTYLLFVHANRKARTMLGLKARSENAAIIALAWLATFFCVVVAWVYFRAVDITSAHNMLDAMLFSGSVDLGSWKQVLSIEFLLIPVGLLIAFFAPNTPQFYEYVLARKKFYWAAGFYTGVLVLLSVIFAMRVEDSPFLYFNFLTEQELCRILNPGFFM